MKHLSILLLLCLFLGCTSTKTTHTKSLLDGVWVPTQQELGGKELPPAAFQGQKLVLDGKAYTFTAESVDKGEVTYSDGQMDIYGKEGVNEGKHFTAIYKYEDEQLTLCYNLAGTDYPSGFDTEGKPLFFLCVFKKSSSK